MIEKKDGRSAAVHDIEGAVLGAAGLAAFAIVVEQALQRTSLGWALALALGAWLATAFALYLAVELTRRGIQRRRTGSPR
jgi:lipopolysaccharide export LptBFGC system permease protein LptF